VDHIVATAPAHTQAVIRTQFLWGQPFGRGNPQAGAIGSDFGRLGVPFWDNVYALRMHTQRRREMLSELMIWRNAIAHNDFDPALFGANPVLHLAQVRSWRSALNGLCTAFDSVLSAHLTGMLGAAPWPPKQEENR
jgi:hypothetical protein